MSEKDDLEWAAFLPLALHAVLLVCVLAPGAMIPGAIFCFSIGAVLFGKTKHWPYQDPLVRKVQAWASLALVITSLATIVAFAALRMDGVI